MAGLNNDASELDESDMKLMVEIDQRKKGLIGPEKCFGGCCYIFSRPDCKKRGPKLYKDSQKWLEYDLRILLAMRLRNLGIVGPERCYGTCCFLYSGPGCKHRDHFNTTQTYAELNSVFKTYRWL